MPHAYRICDLLLSSNSVLPELVPAEGSHPDCHFELLSAEEHPVVEVDWFHSWKADENGEEEENKEPWLRLGRVADGYLLRFPSCGDFIVSTDTMRIECRPLPGIPEVTVRHLLLDQVIPLVLSRRERIVLHASAVLTRNCVIAFAGSSGQGKSTLAMSFAREGCPLFADDCLVLRVGLEGWMAIPSYPGIRLWPSSVDALLRESVPTRDVADYTSKRRLGETEMLRYASGSAPLRGLFVLACGAGEVALEKLSPGRAMIALVKFAYNLDVKDVSFLRRQFDTVARLTEDVPAYAIHYPREFAVLSTVREIILTHLEEGL